MVVLQCEEKELVKFERRAVKSNGNSSNTVQCNTIHTFTAASHGQSGSDTRSRPCS